MTRAERARGKQKAKNVFVTGPGTRAQNTRDVNFSSLGSDVDRKNLSSDMPFLVVSTIYIFVISTPTFKLARFYVTVDLVRLTEKAMEM